METEASGPTTTTTTTTTTTNTTTTFSCPSGWAEYIGGCYNYYTDAVSWFLADAKCLAVGGRLASIHTEEENDFLNTLANGPSYWIGGYPNDTIQKSWVWSDFTEFDYDGTYSTSAGSCLYQSQSSYGIGWKTYPCDSSSYDLFYICKLI